MGKALRQFRESTSSVLPPGVPGAPDTNTPAEAVAATNRRLNAQHAANRALKAARTRAAELEHAIRERKVLLTVAHYLAAC